MSRSISHSFFRLLLFAGALALGSGCKRPYVPAVDKDRIAKLSVKTAYIGATSSLTYTFHSDLAVHDFRSGCSTPGYQGSVALTEGTMPMTSLPANELILLVATWHEGRFLGGNAWCEAGLVFVPEHGKSYVFAFTGPSNPASTSRRLTCGAQLFEQSDGLVPWVLWPGQFGNRQEVCAVGKQAAREASAFRLERTRLIAEAAAARASGEAAARAARMASPPAGSSPKSR